VPPGFAPPAHLADRLADERSPPLAVAVRGDTLIHRPGVRLIALHPGPGYRGSVNDRSLVVALEAFACRVLLTGDVEAAGEAVILDQAQGRLGCDVLKIAHHGSATSTSRPLLAAVGAAEALISVGRWNRFGHPDPAVLRRIEAGGTRVWRTDRDGAIVIEIRRSGWTLTGIRRAR
jgi:competence protein ComEC